MNDAFIGVFDSGVGGLSVLREIRGTLPNENVLYVADSGAAPYGEPSAEFTTARDQFCTSGIPGAVQHMISTLWGRAVEVDALPAV